MTKIYITKDDNGLPNLHFHEPVKVGTVWRSKSEMTLNLWSIDIEWVDAIPNGGMIEKVITDLKV